VDIMVAEYASQMMPELAEEGAAILGTLQTGFRACGHKVHTPYYRGNDRDEFRALIEQTAQMCDAGIVVAPDCLLYDLTLLVETHTKNLGCPAGAVKKAADKLSSSLSLSEASLAVPEIDPATGPYVLKPRYGCGSEEVRVVKSFDRDRLTEDTLVSKFISGEHISVSLVIGKTVLPLSINKQLIRINGLIRYVGNITPHVVRNSDAVLRQASKAAQLLGCKGYVGVDIVIEHVGIATWEKSVKCLEASGRLVTCGATTGYDAKLDLRFLFSRQLSLLGSYMGTKDELRTVLKLVAQGRLKPIVDKVFPLQECAAAHEYLEAGKQFGKVVLTVA